MYSFTTGYLTEVWVMSLRYIFKVTDRLILLNYFFTCYGHMYTLTIMYIDGTTKQRREQSLEKSVASWFDEDGTLLFDILEKDVRDLHNGIASEKKDK